jgi:hypothetical protein
VNPDGGLSCGATLMHVGRKNPWGAYLVYDARGTDAHVLVWGAPDWRYFCTIACAAKGEHVAPKAEGGGEFLEVFAEARKTLAAQGVIIDAAADPHRLHSCAAHGCPPPDEPAQPVREQGDGETDYGAEHMGAREFAVSRADAERAAAQRPPAVLPVETPPVTVLDENGCRPASFDEFVGAAQAVAQQPSPTAGPGPMPIGGLEDALRCGRIWAESGSLHMSVPEQSAAVLAREVIRLRAAAPPPSAGGPAGDATGIWRGQPGGEFEGCVEVQKGRSFIETRPIKNGIAMLVVNGELHPLTAAEARALAEPWTTAPPRKTPDGEALPADGPHMNVPDGTFNWYCARCKIWSGEFETISECERDFAEHVSRHALAKPTGHLEVAVRALDRIDKHDPHKRRALCADCLRDPGTGHDEACLFTIASRALAAIRAAKGTP